ncbi:hypothetical protein [Blastococcus tunisiensis]|uniref:Uncharacterized protein n=1 Tax=Blastococcus tunisiensis TaxID=1798228 RepID=A0A1I2FGP8_9ACTN|nr:hypothetical protein [Blastococcus sp. DSM 46838]SFF03696.1 hypothetical protein SAMN05216574_10883 [Blastococcus sp. DSM 46838]
MSSERATAARMSAAPHGQGRSIAGLIDVLDRAGGAGPVRRPQPRRAAAHRPPGTGTGAVRTGPLRSVQPAPMARPAVAPRVLVVPEPERVPVTRLSDVVRRAALWGAGPRGEHLAWHVAPRPAPAPRRTLRVRALVRRLALWGAGPDGRYLAWGAPARPAVRHEVDPPVVLREMPSTPLIQPAASSPAVVLLPRGPASSAGSRGVPSVPRGAVAVPGVRPCGPPERSRATGWPSPSRASPASTGPTRARGDPHACPARGSPLPAQRSRSPGSAWSSFP